MSVEIDGMELAKRHFSSEGYDVDDVSRKRGHNGYDLVVSRNGESSKIEVKGCTREWQIPDPYFTEFDEQRTLVADYLCVVYMIDGRDPFICIIPRDAIPPEQVTLKQAYRISGKFKKEAVLKPYSRPLSLGQSDGKRAT